LLNGLTRRTVGESVQAKYLRFAAQLHQHHFLVIAGLEAHSGSRGDIEPHSESSRSIETQAPIHFEEMKMRTDLDRAVADVGNLEFCGTAAGIGYHGIRREKIFTWNHRSSPAFR
jgi:hypothetical protein